MHTVNNKEIYPRFARTVPDSMGEATAVVKYFCNEVNTRHLVVPQAAGLWYYNVEFNCICGYRGLS